MPINTGVSGRKVKSEEYFDDSFVYFLNNLSKGDAIESERAIREFDAPSC
jgi:hypothetical protein